MPCSHAIPCDHATLAKAAAAQAEAKKGEYPQVPCEDRDIGKDHEDPKESKPAPTKPKPVPAKPVPAKPKPMSAKPAGLKRIELPVQDLKKRGGGVWAAKNVKWKESEIVDFQGAPAIRGVFPEGSGTGDNSFGGFSFNSTPKGFLPADEAYITFEVFPEKGFDWSRGGKLGGLLIGKGKASGYEHSPTASTHRAMFQTKGGVISYIYPPSGLKQEDPRLKPEGHGIGYFGDTFKAGALKNEKWNTITVGVRNNTFTNSKPDPNGVAYLAVNGVEKTKTDIRWSAKPGTKITEIIMNSFFGGSWTSPKDQVLFFRNFVLETK